MNLSVDLDLGAVIAEARGSLAKYRENKTYNKEIYDELLGKYASAIQLIEMLKNEIDNLKSNKLPTKEEVESVGTLLNLMGVEKLDMEGIKKINDISKMFGGKK